MVETDFEAGSSFETRPLIELFNGKTTRFVSWRMTTRCAKKKGRKEKKEKERKSEQLETIRNVGMIRSDDTRDISLLCYPVVYTRKRKLSFLILLIILNLSVLTSEKLHDYIVAE